jgi:hypothetical protein
LQQLYLLRSWPLLSLLLWFPSRHRWNRVEQHRQLGKLKHYYLDEFNQTGVFIRHKRGMQNSIAIKDRREGSLPNNRPLLPTTVSVIIPQLFWKEIKCCARLAYLEVIIVPLWSLIDTAWRGSRSW